MAGPGRKGSFAAESCLSVCGDGDGGGSRGLGQKLRFLTLAVCCVLCSIRVGVVCDVLDLSDGGLLLLLSLVCAPARSMLSGACGSCDDAISTPGREESRDETTDKTPAQTFVSSRRHHAARGRQGFSGTKTRKCDTGLG